VKQGTPGYTLQFHCDTKAPQFQAPAVAVAAHFQRHSEIANSTTCDLYYHTDTLKRIPCLVHWSKKAR
jgi:hypothetical protein